MENKPESIAESRKIYEAESPDGSLKLSIWDDSQLVERYQSDEEYHGLLTIYSATTGTYFHRARVRLSEAVMSGSEPTDDDKSPWLEILSKVAEE
jgi:hypothetical protein